MTVGNYTPEIVNENDIRSFCSPPLDYNDVSTAEILLKIEAMEQYAKQVYFNGGGLPSTARMPVVMLVISKLLINSSLAKKYGVLKSERLGDYSYIMSDSFIKGSENYSDSWWNIATDILKRIRSPSDYQIRITNE